ncbi:protein RRP6-like 2 isoform X2 [Macadamia integrifolia]|uniref:protein RRP6-like 2 isoform X2 n=1 Tax=Macadamia integrifolia TaxID=60698 RepID=UPI001C4FDC54|nr:protein RRP6-like 2 isoform X2 [Macadamia integrifolia]
MEIDSVPEETLKQKAETLKALATGPLASSVSKLSGSSRGIPSDKDFHFFCNFDEFKVPMKEIAEKSESLLKSIGSSSFLWGKEMIFPQDSEEAYDWLVNVSDEVIERCDVSMDEFHRMRKKEEDGGKRISSIISEDGFQLVSGKKKKAGSNSLENVKGDDSSPVTSVKVASRDKKTTGARPRVPFHIPSIVRPQDQYKIMVNNSNQPFEHVWLKRSEDGSRFIHPLEELSVYDFVDRNIGNVESVKPLPIESTPFKLIEEVKDLKELAAKLQNVDEFAVDLEHNQYRSFQGMTCLMQISTRSEDYVVDTLKLRVLIGPHLRELFKDPLKKKVMHGADRDIVWLQRDFGIYICNLFDTGQASRVLQLERNSLEYLLHHFCGVTANKEYQNADWRLRPIPDEMLRYAREDTHYLLHIYDLMRARLLSAQADSESGDDLLSEVYRRSYDICMQLYEKELLTDTSYLHVYGLGGANFNAQQLAIVAGLCEWRDVVARAEDESTGYILPNKAVLEIARQMPLNAGKLRRLVRSKHSYVERNLSSVLNIIENSIQNAASFETAAEQLKKGQLERASDENVEVIAVESDALPTMAIPTRMLAAAAETMNTNGDYDDSVNGKIGECIRVPVKEETLAIVGNAFESDTSRKGGPFELPCEAGKIKNEQDYVLELPKGSPALSAQLGDTNIEMGSKTSAKTVTGATVQMLKKPSRAFGALLGSSTSKRKLNPDKKVEHADPVHDRVALVGDHVNSNGGLHEDVNDLGQKKSFVAAVGRKTLPNVEALPDPVKGVDITRLQISQIAYEEQVQKHIFALIGRLNLHSLSLQTDKAEMKVEQIISSVNLPFHSFSGSDKQLKPLSQECKKPLEIHTAEPVATLAEVTNLEDIISLECGLDDQESTDGLPNSANDALHHRENDNDIGSILGSDTGDEPMSLSDLSSSFQKCFQSKNHTENNGQVQSSHESEGLQLKPFDYAAARKQVKFGKDKEAKGEGGSDEGPRGLVGSKERRKSSVVNSSPIDEEAKDFQQPRRRQAFPVTGNRSATFR